MKINSHNLSLTFQQSILNKSYELKSKQKQILDLSSPSCMVGDNVFRNFIADARIPANALFERREISDSKMLQALKAVFLPNCPNSVQVVPVAGLSAMRSLLMMALEVDMFLVPVYSANSINPLLALHGIRSDVFIHLDYLFSQALNLKGTAVVLNDDIHFGTEAVSAEKLYQLIVKLTENGATVIFETGFSRLFYPHLYSTFHSEIAQLPNVVMLENTTELLGIGGLQFGYIATNHAVLANELRILTYHHGNSPNILSGILLQKLLVSDKGLLLLAEYTNICVSYIQENFKLIHNLNLLGTAGIEEFGTKTIHVRVKSSEEDLLKSGIYAPKLAGFSFESNPITATKVNLSADPLIFKSYFEKATI